MKLTAIVDTDDKTSVMLKNSLLFEAEKQAHKKTALKLDTATKHLCKFLDEFEGKGDFVTFDRKKTENTERDKQSITVYINDRMRAVIRKYGNKSLDPESYVFPILRPGMSSKQRKSTIREYIKDTNELLAIAQSEINKDRKEKEKLTVKLTTGTARYTTATLLKKHGIDLSTIAKALGHGSEATTEHYTEEGRETTILISKALSL